MPLNVVERRVAARREEKLAPRRRPYIFRSQASACAVIIMKLLFALTAAAGALRAQGLSTLSRRELSDLPACGAYALEDAVAAWLDDADAAAVIYGDIAAWDTSCITSMSDLLRGTDTDPVYHNVDLRAWDVSSVENLNSVFNNARAFNADLGDWDVASVRTMRYMMYHAESFHRDLGAWDVSTVLDMHHWCGFCSAFNGDVSTWDVSRVTNMYGMFGGNRVFNGDVSAWDVSSVTTAAQMFQVAPAFNGDLTAWDLRANRDMRLMFDRCSSFDRELGWCVAADVSLDGAFDGAACEATACGVTQGACDMDRVKKDKDDTDEATPVIIVVPVCVAAALLIGVAAVVVRKRILKDNQPRRVFSGCKDTPRAPEAREVAEPAQ